MPPPQAQTWLPLHVAGEVQSASPQQPPAAMQPRPGQCFSPPLQVQVPSLQVLPPPQSLFWQHSVPVTQPLGPTVHRWPLVQPQVLVVSLQLAGAMQSVGELQHLASPAFFVYVQTPKSHVAAALWQLDGAGQPVTSAGVHVQVLPAGMVKSHSPVPVLHVGE
jgi:hypothetical protein